MKVFSIETETIRSLNDLDQYCKKLISRLQNLERAIILLKGDLGSGKTKTVETFLHQLGIENVSSPTFAIHHNYKSKEHTIEHFDLYRIENLADLESTGFWDVFAQNKSWVIVEWADRLDSKDLPTHWPRVEIEIAFDHQDKSQTRVMTTKFYFAANKI